jgi:hypothetical protein
MKKRLWLYGGILSGFAVLIGLAAGSGLLEDTDIILLFSGVLMSVSSLILSFDKRNTKRCPDKILQQ